MLRVYFSQSVHERSTMQTHKLSWENLEERNIKHMATEISKTCRMCSRRFGTILSRENHELQEHRFTASKRGKKKKKMPSSFPLYIFMQRRNHILVFPLRKALGLLPGTGNRERKMEPGCGLELTHLGWQGWRIILPSQIWRRSWKVKVSFKETIQHNSVGLQSKVEPCQEFKWESGYGISMSKTR